MFDRVTAGQPTSSDEFSAIIGGVAGGVLALIVLVASIVWCCCCSQRARARAWEKERDRTANKPTERFEPYRPPPPPPPPPEQDGAHDVQSPEPGDGAAGGDALQDQDGALGTDNGVADRDVAREIEDASLEPDRTSDTPRERGHDMSVAQASSVERDGSDAVVATDPDQFSLQDGAEPGPEEAVLNESHETELGRNDGFST